MQEEKQNISPIKQRILQFVETLHISKRDFYLKTGISRGTLESKTGITEETITKLFATYKDISAEWLLRGRGNMLESISQVEKKVINTEPNPLNKDALTMICDLSAENALLKKELEELKREKKNISAHYGYIAAEPHHELTGKKKNK
jgi:hypothetical protein